MRKAFVSAFVFLILLCLCLFFSGCDKTGTNQTDQSGAGNPAASSSTAEEPPDYSPLQVLVPQAPGEKTVGYASLIRIFPTQTRDTVSLRQTMIPPGSTFRFCLPAMSLTPIF